VIVSQARIEANRKNSLRSTGPKTPEGKERSRANALKHGLCASALVPEDLESIQARAREWYYSLKPQNRFQAWMVDQVAVISLRVDRSERIERRLRDKVALRSELSWDDDRRLEAEMIGGDLARRPAETVERLRSTPQGCDWLMTRWAMLAHVADTVDWTADQARLAFDLLGTPAEFRSGLPGAPIDPDGRAIDDPAKPAEIARSQIEALRGRRERVADLDEVDRALASADLTHDADADLRRLRRYESTLHRRLRWCLGQIRYQSPHFKPHPDVEPRWAAQPEPKPEALAADPAPAPVPAPVAAHPPAPAPMPKPLEFWMAVPPHAPFDLEPDECPPLGVEIDFPAILAARGEKQAKKAESCRNARRRKLERLRA